MGLKSLLNLAICMKKVRQYPKFNSDQLSTYKLMFAID